MQNIWMEEAYNILGGNVFVEPKYFWDNLK